MATNPQDAIKQYNRNAYIFKNKNSIIGLAILAIIVLLGIIYFLWSSGDDTPTDPLVLPNTSTYDDRDYT